MLDLTSKGGKISCKGDQQVFRRGAFCCCASPARCIRCFCRPRRTEISTLIGFPLRIRKHPPGRALEVLAYTRMRMPPRRPCTLRVRLGDRAPFRFAGQRWQYEDGKHRNPYQGEAVCHYCQFRLQPVLEDSLGTRLVERAKEDVLGFMIKEKHSRLF